MKNITLNSKIIIKKEKSVYKKYKKYNYSIRQSNFNAFHDTIDYFLKNKKYTLSLDN